MDMLSVNLLDGVRPSEPNCMLLIWNADPTGTESALPSQLARAEPAGEVRAGRRCLSALRPAAWTSPSGPAGWPMEASGDGALVQWPGQADLASGPDRAPANATDDSGSGSGASES